RMTVRAFGKCGLRLYLLMLLAGTFPVVMQAETVSWNANNVTSGGSYIDWLTGGRCGSGITLTLGSLKGTLNTSPAITTFDCNISGISHTCNVPQPRPRQLALPDINVSFPAAFFPGFNAYIGGPGPNDIPCSNSTGPAGIYCFQAGDFLVYFNA